MMAACVRSVAELAETDWATERGLFTEVSEGLQIPSAPWRSDQAKVGARTHVALLGADSRNILLDRRFDPDEIDALIESGAVLVNM
jgi:crotonobetainyl-CoA:carnitine CoA-transferase CaiB-like acyl-CoA transferase